MSAMSHPVFRCIIVSAVFWAGPGAAPSHAASRTASEETHCLAVGITLSRLAAAEMQVVRMLKDTADANRVAELEAHASETSQTGAKLQARFASAHKPTREELDALDRTPLDDLTDTADACLQ